MPKTPKPKKCDEAGVPRRWGRFPALLQIRVPSYAPQLVECVASQRNMTPAEYMRRSIFRQLKEDGVDPFRVEAA